MATPRDTANSYVLSSLLSCHKYFCRYAAMPCLRFAADVCAMICRLRHIFLLCRISAQRAPLPIYAIFLPSRDMMPLLTPDATHAMLLIMNAPCRISLLAFRAMPPCHAATLILLRLRATRVSIMLMLRYAAITLFMLSRHDAMMLILLFARIRHAVAAVTLRASCYAMPPPRLRPYLPPLLPTPRALYIDADTPP